PAPPGDRGRGWFEASLAPGQTNGQGALMETPRFPTVSPLDADALRQAAREVRTAEDDLAALNAMVARPFLPTEQELRDAEQAFAQAKAARKELPPAWRRTLGAALCGTGMVILIGALSWDRYWFPVPVGLIAI